MDPTYNLREQLELARLDWTGRDTKDLTITELMTLHDAHVRLCDLVVNLHEWIINGGRLPKYWDKAIQYYAEVAREENERKETI